MTTTALALWGSPVMDGAVEVTQADGSKRLDVKLTGEGGVVFGVCVLEEGVPNPGCRAGEAAGSFLIRIDQGGDAAFLGVLFKDKTVGPSFAVVVGAARNPPANAPLQARGPVVKGPAKLNLNLDGKIRTTSGAAVYMGGVTEGQDRVTLSAPPAPSGVQRRVVGGCAPRSPVAPAPPAAPTAQQVPPAVVEASTQPAVQSAVPAKTLVDLDDIFNSPVKPAQTAAQPTWGGPTAAPSHKAKDDFDDFFN